MTRRTRPAFDRMADKVVVMAAGYETPCWVFTGYVNKRNGYGYIGVGSKSDGTKRLELTHRIAYERRHGPIPDGMEPHHLCEVRACCNPEHLRAVTRGENAGLGRAAKLDEEKVREIRSSTESGVELAARFGVWEETISKVRTGRTWKWVV